MTASEIVQKLKTTPYKFTFASKMRDEVKKMTDDDSDFLIMELRREMAKPENREILTSLREIIYN